MSRGEWRGVGRRHGLVCTHSWTGSDAFSALLLAVLQEGMAVLSMPDGQKVEFPVLLDAAGAKFIDVSSSGGPSACICPAFLAVQSCLLA